MVDTKVATSAGFRLPSMAQIIPMTLCRPGKERQEHMIREGLRAGFNYPHTGATQGAQPGPLGQSLGWPWVIDSRRIQVGRGKQTYRKAKALLQRWGHFQLGWAQVDPATRVAPGTPFCVVAQSLFAWSSNPLRVVYVTESPPGGEEEEEEGGGRGSRRGLWGAVTSFAKAAGSSLLPPPLRRGSKDSSSGEDSPLSSSSSGQASSSSLALSALTSNLSSSTGSTGRGKRGRGGAVSGNSLRRWQYGVGCLGGHLLAGEESFAVEWDPADDSVWFEVLTFSRPAHPLSLATYPLVRHFQRRFGAESAASVVKALAEEQ